MSGVPGTIRAVVADDEPLARRGIMQLLEAHPDVVVERQCDNGLDALAALDVLAPDLLFLDVQMPELDGFGVMQRARASRAPEEMPLTIFLTAYEEFAVDAFEVEALDYLVKPVGDERFAAAMSRARARLRPDRRTAPAPASHLAIPTPRGHLVLSTDEVEWIAADDCYMAVHARGKRHLLRESMSSLEARLDDSQFVRVHRGAIVNVRRVREVRTIDGQTTLVLVDGTRIPVSRRRRSALARALG